MEKKQKLYTRFCLRAFAVLHAITTVALCCGTIEPCLAFTGLGISNAVNFLAFGCIVYLCSLSRRPTSNQWYIAIVLIISSIVTAGIIVSVIIQLIYCFSSTCLSGTLFRAVLVPDNIQCSKGTQVATIFLLFTQLTSTLYSAALVL
jgi:hypothetical protein